MKYLQNDLITPLEQLAESDVLYVKVCCVVFHITCMYTDIICAG